MVSFPRHPMNNFSKVSLLLLVCLVSLFAGFASVSAQEDRSEEEREGDMDTTLRFIQEGQDEEDRSRMFAVTYKPNVPTAIVWCVQEDLKAVGGEKNVDVLAVVRESSGRWAVAVSKVGTQTYYTSMIKPRDNIEILGSSESLEEAVDLVPEEGRSGLLSTFTNSYNPAEAGRESAVKP